MPERFGGSGEDGQRLKDALLYDHAIEVLVHGTRGRVWMRLSGQVYNDPQDLDRLARAVESIA